ncbi:MAG: TatD family hydrolase [Lentisphaeria bacterium]
MSFTFPEFPFPPGLYDIHAHLADQRLRPVLPEILQRCEACMQAVLVNAAQVDEWDTVLELAQHPKLYAALGVHPFFSQNWQAGTLALLEEKLLHAPPPAKILAIGEIGLDFQNGREHASAQRRALSEQLLLAQRLQLPVILHNRKSWPDFFSLLKELHLPLLTGVCHHFNASPEIARQALDHGLYLSFCGPLTWPESHRLQQLACYPPLDRILAETDCPDLPPQSCRNGESRPWMVTEVIHKIAELRGLRAADMQIQIAANWQSLFSKQNKTCKNSLPELS